MGVIDLKQHTRFWWTERDVSALLPGGWADQVVAFANVQSAARTLTASSVTSREATTDMTVPVLTVSGVKVRVGLPWLYDLYRGFFRDLCQDLVAEPVSIAQDDRYGINLNVQRGCNMRYECHVDSNPVEGLLYVTTHLPGEGGELIVSNDPRAVGPEQIQQDCTRIYPSAGKLVFFDARRHPHFVAALQSNSAIRVAAAMNYYVPSCPEDARPADLNRHLFGQD